MQNQLRMNILEHLTSLTFLPAGWVCYVWRKRT